MRIIVQRVDGRPDPARLVAAITGTADDVVWLDADGRDARARWSVLGATDGPFAAVLTHTDGVSALTTGQAGAGVHGGPRTGVRGCFDVLEELLAAVPPLDEPVPGCGFALGWVGYLGYELGRESVPTPGATPPAPAPAVTSGLVTFGSAGSGREEPDAVLRFLDRAVVLDAVDGVAWVLALVTDAAPVSDARNVTWADRTADLVRALTIDGREAREATGGGLRRSAEAGPSLPAGSGRVSLAAPGRVARTAYEHAVDACREEIRQGNAIQICLTTAFRVPGPDGQGRPGGQARPDGQGGLVWRGSVDDGEDGLVADPAFREHLRIRDRDPVPFGSFLRLGGVTVASRSPERFLRITADGTAVAEPIKGTRPRGATTEEDEAARLDLATSAKDRAENVMIVDLLRNDLLRTAVPGTVRVERLCDVESYATVHQLVSTVVGTLPAGASRAGAVRAAFPPGSMTGAPRSSAMAIARRLERAPRGVYSGAIGYFSLSGAVDLAVSIRTLVTVRSEAGGRGDVVARTLGAGGAVTWSSSASGEADEVEAKTRSVLGGIGAAVAW